MRNRAHNVLLPNAEFVGRCYLHFATRKSQGQLDVLEDLKLLVTFVYSPAEVA